MGTRPPVRHLHVGRDTRPVGSGGKKKPQGNWQVSRVIDPITGASTCVVAAMDRAAGLIFTQVGGLYPLVENNPVHGLLGA